MSLDYIIERRRLPDGRRLCGRCDGTKTLISGGSSIDPEGRNPASPPIRWDKCLYCNGTGIVTAPVCTACRGSGYGPPLTPRGGYNDCERCRGTSDEPTPKQLQFWRAQREAELADAEERAAYLRTVIGRDLEPASAAPQPSEKETKE